MGSMAPQYWHLRPHDSLERETKNRIDPLAVVVGLYVYEEAT